MRLKREDCDLTKHDFIFSKWEILIGPNDWKDHASGKDGVERYRIHNLPAASSCTGLYELGVASIPTTEGHRLRKLDWENVIVVYLGQADNVRTRLQEYGRSGSHLDHGNLITHRKNSESSSAVGLGLFKDIFSKGYSIMFRWAPIKSKMEAEKIEIQLLRIFDYAWNRKGNGMCRHAEILAMLVQNSPNSGHSPLRRLLQWKQKTFSKREGINIDSVVPFSEKLAPSPGLKGFLLPGILKFSSSQLQFLPQDINSVNDQIICGIATGHGLICIKQPLPGRKRCAEHKGRKITASGSASGRMTSSCDIFLEDGTKGCEFSDGRRVTIPLLDEVVSPSQQYQSQLAQEKFHHDKEENVICGVVCGDGCVCKRRPVLGRKRCESHKGQRVLAAVPSVDKILNSLPLNNFCGVINGNGYACSRPPVPGRKRCEEHKGRRIVSAGNINVSRAE
ncbi:protein EFFECTOR OF TRANSCRIPTION 2-like [Phalaenopsis equestris]|uniref:protein EFFECTOR OF TRANSCRIPTION 2-like n=1 Tax=Phalaenopsis equestris TaxID=78828 RepID=UPI0009E54C2C|nr:protein EFFECTOR OF TRANSCRIPTION 2-like [Phalaenopsis equestris]